jgi:hypothetical protein
MDFSQNFCMVMKYDGVSDAVNKLGTRPRGSLITVAGNRLRIVQGQGEVLVDAPVDQVHVLPPKKTLPGVASIDVGENHWLVDFGKVHKSTQRAAGGFAARLTAGSSLGNLKALKVGNELRARFISSLGSQGAAVES